MSNVRMFFVEADAQGIAAVADVVRMALGQPLALLLPPESQAAAVPAPVEEEPVPSRLPFKFKDARGKAKKAAGAARTAEPAAVAPARVTTEDTIPARVLDMIRKGPPRTSSQIYAVLRKQGFTGAISAVYNACAYHKQKGLVVTLADDSDEGGGVAKYHPVALSN